MSKKEDLRIQRLGTIINNISKKQESDVSRAILRVIDYLQLKFPQVSLNHQYQWKLINIVESLSKTYKKVDFHYHFGTSSIRPDGGILFLQDKNKSELYPILIAEVKNQGTNDQRKIEGLTKQAKGNAIERLGKNVIGLRAALLRESIFPFVCFGYGCDFTSDSSILDRVTTIAMFGHLNRTYLHADESGKFNRGSFYFRENKWTIDEMSVIMSDIAERSIQYYFSKYQEHTFKKDSE